MNRITQLFETKKSGILSVYFTAGYPALNDTLRTLTALQAKGIDMVEIGIPFSDPMADGPVIQGANMKALQNGMSLHLLFEQLKELRQTIRIPVILMGYLNPVMQFGFEAFCLRCAATGVDGVIIPDLPFADYLADYKDIAEQYDIKIIMLISPETSEERIRLIDEHTSGFIYMVSSAATTGAQNRFADTIQDYFQRVRTMNLRNQQLIGFGISNRETLQAATANASGAIVGSKFIELLGENAEPEEAVAGLLRALGKD
jgi:tryptophan synthase alpha chain